MVRLSHSRVLANLKNNSKVNFVIRLVPYNQKSANKLAIGYLPTLGPEGVDYTFVADYSELRGYSAAESAEMLGGSMNLQTHVSAVIFPLSLNTPTFPDFLPANARGLLQIVRTLDDSYKGTLEYSKPFNVNNKLEELDPKLANDEVKDLDSSDISRWRWEHYQQYYKDYCITAYNFISGDFSAKRKISRIGPDWHALGFAQNLSDGSNPDPAPCDLTAWDQKAAGIQDLVGARVFLIKNIKLQDLQDQVLIDFFYPDTTPIPDFGMSK